jgi:hypothetical protein
MQVLRRLLETTLKSIDYIEVRVTLKYGRNTGQDPFLQNVILHMAEMILLVIIWNVAIGRKYKWGMKYTGLDRAIKLKETFLLWTQRQDSDV